MTSKEMEALKEVSELARNLRDSFSKVQDKVTQIEEKDWTEAWRYTQILKQKLEQYKENLIGAEEEVEDSGVE